GVLYVGAFRHARETRRMAAHAAWEHAQMLRHMNAALAEFGAVAWEADFRARRIEGASAVEALLGREATYRDLAESGCFATKEDRPLVQAAFKPSGLWMRRVGLEHAATSGEGAAMRLRHEGLVRTHHEGAPERLFCITHRVDAGRSPAPAYARE